MENKESYYMNIPASVWNTDLNAKAILMYGHITVLSNKEGFCYANNKYFERVLTISTSSVNRYMNQLESMGLIRRELIYKPGTMEVEQRRIYMNIGIITSEHRPIITGEHGPIVTGEQDNTTSNNNTSNNTILDVPSDTDTDKDFYGKIFFRIVDAYPKNRIGNRQHGLKKFKTLSKEEAKLAAKNLKRYLTVSGEFVKSLQNYIEQACFTEEWLQAEEAFKNKKQQTNKPDTKTFDTNY